MDVGVMFAWGPVAFRRVDTLQGTHAVVDGARVPRALLPKVEAGQWLRFERDERGQVDVQVDLRATLDGESKLDDLFEQLLG
jgi:hypothetical protein